MKVVTHASLKRVIIDPGEYYVSNENLIISTLLGSCVSACLWDPVNRIVGMNHFLLAHTRYRVKGEVLVSEAGRYGIHSMELMINTMLKSGAQRRHIRAKAFGGGSMMGNRPAQDKFFAVGAVNVRFIREFLQREKIPLDKEHLGGDQGRIIHFHSHDFSVYMKRIAQQRRDQLTRQERRYWLHEIVEHEKDEHDASVAQYW